MAKMHQPPKLLSRVIRAVAGLKQQKGSTVNSIVDYVQWELHKEGSITRNVLEQIQRALKYAVNIGALLHKSGKYKMAMKRKVIPVDSLELAIDYRARRARRARRDKIRKKVRFKKQKRRYRKRSSESLEDDKYLKKRTYRHHHHKSKPKKSIQNKKRNLLEKKVEPREDTAPSQSSQDQMSDLPSDHKIPAPHDQNENLNRKKNRPGADNESGQTPYPGYKDTMPDDEKKTLDKVPEKPRRPRRPVLPCGKEQNNTSAENPEPEAHEDNDKNKSENVKACHRHSRKRSRTRSRTRGRSRSQKRRSRYKSKRRKQHDYNN